MEPRSEEQLIKIGTTNEATATVPVMKLRAAKIRTTAKFDKYAEPKNFLNL